jgi:phytoene synthase
LNEERQAKEVRRIAKAGDPDRYAAALFVPPEARPHLLALYAFNVELARIGEQINEPQLGEIRLQWWRDALDRAVAGESSGHPVADAIGRTASECELSVELLHSLIDARHFDVSVKIMPGVFVLEDYIAETAGTIFQLSAGILGGGGEQAWPAARAAGLAYGLTGLMRVLPLHISRGRIDLPADLLQRHGISQAGLLAGERSAGLEQVLRQLREKAREASAEASRQLTELAAPSRQAFRPLALVGPHLGMLERVDPLGEIVHLNPLYRLWRLALWQGR